MKRLALLGASGHGRVVADAALCSGWGEVVFFDDAWPKCDCNGLWPVVGDGSMLLAQLADYDGVLVSIGNCRVRWEKQQNLAAAGALLATIIHPAAAISRYAMVEPGTVIMAGAVVNIGAVVGTAGIINTGATVDHDCRLAEAVHICPGAHLSGNVQVGRCSWIGVGAAVKQCVTIGADVTVGAGAVVVGSIADAGIVIGNPARPKVL